MKYITLLFIALYFNACGGSKNSVSKTAKNEAETSKMDQVNRRQSQDLVFDYIEQSRGFYRMIKITPEIISTKFKHDGKVHTKPCDKALWSYLMNEMEKLSLDEISKLEAPSTTHRFDAKPMANLKITKANQTYSTLTFDAGNPNEKILNLVNKMLTVVDNKN